MTRPRSILPLLACAGCQPAQFDERAWVSDDIGTVIEVEWEPIGDGEAWVEFGPTQSYGHTTPAVPDGDAPSEAVLLGNKPLQDVHWRIVATRDDRTWTGDDQVIETRGVAAALPDFSLRANEGCLDGWVLGVSWSAESFLYLLDADADVVWYQALPLTTVTLAVEPIPGQAAVRHMKISMDYSLDTSEIVTVGLDGRELDTVEAEQGHHAFVAHEDGSLAWLAIDVREHEDAGPLVGDRVLVRDADSGQTTQLWSTWDHLDYDPDATLGTEFYPQGTDWTHANSLHWSETRGSYWITLGGVNQLVEIDAETGELLTLLQDDGYALQPMIKHWGAGFGPHGANWTSDDTLLLFDNAYHDEVDASRVLEYELDEDAGVATQLWRHEGQRGWNAMVLGGADRLDGGETFVHWGGVGSLQLLDADGQQCWLVQQSSIVSDAVVLRDLYGRE